MSGVEESGSPSAIDLDAAEITIKEALLRLYYVRNKLRARGAAEVPSLAAELHRLERRAEELTALWASVRRERALVAAERVLSAANERERAASLALEELRESLELAAAERTLRRELGGG